MDIRFTVVILYLGHFIGVNSDFDSTSWLNVAASQTPLTVKPGEVATLLCEAQASSQPSVSWYSNSSSKKLLSYEVEAELSAIDWVSVVSGLRVQVYATTVFRCDVAAGGLKYPAFQTIYVPVSTTGFSIQGVMLPRESPNEKPAIVYFDDLYTGFSGGDAVLPCRLTDNAIGNATWLGPNNQTLSKNDKFSISNLGDLTIRNLALKDNGTYTCVVENSKGKDQIETVVQIS